MSYSMNPIEWLCANAQGFINLEKEEKEAIMHFSFLWSFFESEVFNTRASADAIIAKVHKWAAKGRLNIIPFTAIIAYFRDRYYENGNLTNNFQGLKFRPNDSKELVIAVLKGENTNPADCVAALLVIVYRIRNNLFHGIKWADGISGQLNNFTCANAALMAALDIHLSDR